MYPVNHLYGPGKPSAGDDMPIVEPSAPAYETTSGHTSLPMGHFHRATVRHERLRLLSLAGPYRRQKDRAYMSTTARAAGVLNRSRSYYFQRLEAKDRLESRAYVRLLSDAHRRDEAGGESNEAL